MGYIQPDNQDPNPNPDPNPGAGGAAPNANVNAGAPGAGGAGSGGGGQMSAYDELAAKKGYKSHDDMAKGYGDAETELGRRQATYDKAKASVEAKSNGTLTLDKDGNVIDVGGSGGGQNAGYQDPNAAGQGGAYGNQGGQGGAYGQPDPVYDPYTGQQLTNPVDIQLAKMSPSERTGAMFNVLMTQREQQQSQAFTADQEVLSKPEAKGFEGDVRKIMQNIPMAQRANKQNWEQALLQAKGARYDNDSKNWGAQGVDQFINTQGAQGMGGSSAGAGGGGGLTPDQESTYQHYAQNSPGMFKDRAHFLSRTKPDGGRN